MSQYVPASLVPDSFVKGGLVNNVDVEVLPETKFADFSYTNKAETGTGLVLKFRELESGTIHDQFYSCGGKLRPSQDGRFLVAEGSAAISSSSNLAAFMTVLVKVGFPKQMLATGDVTALHGLKFHAVRVKASSIDAGRTGGDVKDSDVLVASRIIALPGETGSRPAPAPASAGQFAPPAPAAAPWAPAPPAPTAPATPPAAPPAFAPPAAAQVSDATKGKVANALIGALGQNPSIPVLSASQAIFAALMADPSVPQPEKMAAVQLATSVEFLAALGLKSDGVNITR